MRKKTILLATIIYILAAIFLTASIADNPKERLIVIGLDGTRPEYLFHLAEQGILPNIARLIEGGASGSILPPLPPPSPVSWSSFKTGTDPSKHGVFGFFSIADGKYQLNPKGYSTGLKEIWDYLSNAGKTGIVINMYDTDPRIKRKGILISGMKTNDKLGGYLIYSNLKDKTPYQKINIREASGWTNLPDSYSPPLEAEVKIVSGEQSNFLYFLLLDTVDEGINEYNTLAVSFKKDGRAILASLESGETSPRFSLNFSSDKIGTAYLKVLKNNVEAVDAGELEIYLSPITLTVDGFCSNPELLKSAVPETARLNYVVDAPFGPGNLIIDYDTFLEGLYSAAKAREITATGLLAKTDWDYFIMNFTSTDRLQHVLWHATDPTHPMYTKEIGAKYGDCVDKFYRFIDTEVGKILDYADENTTILLLSDHGFSAVKYALSINAHLQKMGWLVLKEAAKNKKMVNVWQDVDWSKTKAVAYDIDPQIRINLKGREAAGIVAPGREYRELKQAISDYFEKRVINEKTGEKMVSRVFDYSAIYPGPASKYAGDLRIAFNPTFRSMDVTGVFAPGILGNEITSGWSGDHVGDPKFFKGFLIVNGNRIKPQKEVKDVEMQDLAPTILRIIGQEKPAEMDGKVLPIFK